MNCSNPCGGISHPTRKWVNLNNIPSEGIRGTIVSAGFEEVGQSREEKPVIRLEDESGDMWAFVVNQTNGAILGSLHGRGFDRWEGKPIVLVTGTAGYKGKDVPSVVVDRTATRAAKEVVKPVVAKPIAPTTYHPGDDNDTPF